MRYTLDANAVIEILRNNGGVLVTRNLKHFGRVPGLRLESWEA